MTDQDIDALLNQHEWAGIKLGLERVRQLLAALGNPHQRIPMLHVAGTNGKGSVCAYVSSILLAAGYRVGRYTSPHLVSWCERICVDNVPIAPSALGNILTDIKAAISLLDEPPSQFEIITAAAWVYFAQQDVEIVVMEVGLGGRLDATNVCDRPLVSIITSISRDHAHILGDTLAAIAGEKAGILKPHCPAVIAPQPPDVEVVLRQTLSALNCRAIFPQPSTDLGNGWACYTQVEDNAPISPTIPYSPPSIFYPLPLLGAVQLTNSAVAIAAIHLLREQGWQIHETAIVQGMEAATWRGRLEWTTYRGHRLLIDGAHNVAGIQALRQYVDQQVIGEDQPTIHWVVGMMGRKDHAEMLSKLLQPRDWLYLVPVPDRGTANPAALATLATQLYPTLHHCQAYPDLFTALDLACATAYPQPKSLVILCGSLYLVGYFLLRR